MTRSVMMPKASWLYRPTGLLLRVSRHAPRFCSPSSVYGRMDDLFIPPPPNWIIGIEEIWEIKFQTKQLHSTISCRFILNFKNETSVSDEVSSYSQYPSKVHVANMGPTWVLSAPGGPHVGPMNLAISVDYENGNYDDVIMGAIASQITILTSVYSTFSFRRRSQKTSKLRVTGLCVGNSPGTGEFSAQMASNAVDAIPHLVNLVNPPHRGWWCWDYLDFVWWSTKRFPSGSNQDFCLANPKFDGFSARQVLGIRNVCRGSIVVVVKVWQSLSVEGLVKIPPSFHDALDLAQWELAVNSSPSP